MMKHGEGEGCTDVEHLMIRHVTFTHSEGYIFVDMQNLMMTHSVGCTIVDDSMYTQLHTANHNKQSSYIQQYQYGHMI